MAVADARAWIDRAALAGASSLRANLSTLTPKTPFDVAPVADSFRELAGYAAEKNIVMLTENHFGHSIAIDNVVALLEAVDSPNLRTIFDWGNVPSPSTASVIDAARRLAPWLYLVSAKGVNFDADYRATDYDVAAIVKATEALGFRGDYSIELFGPTPPGFDAVKAIGAMRTAVEAGLQ
jgi:sugar phosphate isomerase/epimerase